MVYSNTYARIDLDAILHNFRAVRQRAGSKVMAVVKADAYGHGAVPVAKLLEPESDFFGVSSVSEALELRGAGITLPILILGHTPIHGFACAVSQEIRVAIFSYEEARLLSQEAVKQQKTAFVHIALDTGMSRIGFQPGEESAELCREIARLPGLQIEGLFSHFATADETNLDRTNAQAKRFEEFCVMLERLGVQIPLRHLDNSAGVMNFGSHYEMVRAGIVLYGLYPSNEVDRDKLDLQPAMSWHTEVSHVKTLGPGRQISYGGTFEVKEPTRVATIPAGYADGYRRSLSNQFYVLIRGKKAPILGRICMDQFVVDVTDIPGVVSGDPVVLLGTDGDERISAETIAAAANSFNYEQVCDLSRRVARVYVKDGKLTDAVDYLLK